MKRTTKSILAFVVLMAMCVSFCVPTFAAASDELNLLADGVCPGMENGVYKTHTKENCTYEAVGEYVKAVCGKHGYQTYKCTVCGTFFAADFDYSMLDAEHDVPRTEPTCTEDGSIKGYCSVCNTYVDEVIKAHGSHDFQPADSTGTSCVDGIKTEMVCTRCGEKGEPVVEAPKNHNWVIDTSAGDKGILRVPTCTVAGEAQFKCSNKGCTQTLVKEITFEAAGLDADEAHNWYHAVTIYEATCSSTGAARGYCLDCGISSDDIEGGVIVLEKLPHPATKFVEAVAPTCTEDGTTAGYVCTVCGEGDGDRAPQVDPKLDHKNQGTIYKMQLPTCTENGLVVYDCADCGLLQSKAIPATGHEYNEEEDEPAVHVPPTCTTFGYDIYCCTRCGEISETKDGIVTIPPLEHNLVEDESQRIEATCEHAGEKVFYCMPSYDEGGNLVHPGCTDEHGNPTKVVIYVDAPDHNYVLTTVKPVCIGGGKYKDGYVCQMCTMCGNEKPNSIVKKVTYADVEDKENGIEHTWYPKQTTPPTCTEYGVRIEICRFCLLEKTPVAIPPAHTFVAVAGGATQFDCVLGTLVEAKCSECGEIGFIPEDENYVGNASHDFTSNKATEKVVDVTCTEDGYTYYICGNENCVAVSANQDVVPATGHTWDMVLVPDCKNDKVTYYKECTVCGETETPTNNSLEFDKTNPDHHNYTLEEIITMNGGNVVGSYIIEIMRDTCFARDVWHVICPDCGDQYAIYGEYHDHWTNYEELIDTDATKYSAEYPYVPAKDATCYEEGYTASYYCLSCQANGFDLEDCYVEGIKIDKIAHTLVDVDKLDPTCTEKGHEAGKECSVPECDYVEWVELDALGHTDVAVPGYAPKCGVAGRKDAFYCSVCQPTVANPVLDEDGNVLYVYVDGEVSYAAEDIVIDALVHIFNTDAGVNKPVTRAPLCETAGLTLKYCTVFGCDYSEVTEFKFATGHTEYDRTPVTGLTQKEYEDMIKRLEWLDRDATCASNGVIAHVCFDKDCDGAKNLYGIANHVWFETLYRTYGYHETKDGTKFDDACVDAEGNLVSEENRVCVFCCDEGETVGFIHNTQLVIQHATCVNPEYTFFKCVEEACGYEELLDVSGEPTGHIYTNVHTVREATIYADGIKENRCIYYDTCGQAQEEYTYSVSGIKFNYDINSAGYDKAKDTFIVSPNQYFVNSGLVAVTITANASDFDFSNLVLTYNFDTNNIKFVDAVFTYGTVDAGFDVEITDAKKANADGTVSIVAAYSNENSVLSNKTWDIDDGKINVAVLYFYIEYNAVKGTPITLSTSLTEDGYCSIAKVKNEVKDEEGTVTGVVTEAVTANVTFADNLNDVLFGAMNDILDTKDDESKMTPHVIARLGDLDNNGDINATDMSMLLASFFSASDAKVEADINKDGVLTLEDYELLRTYVAKNKTYQEMAEEPFEAILKTIRGDA